MALFEYFPNYIWNLSVAIATESGGQIGELVDMCKPLGDAADSGADAGTPQFHEAMGGDGLAAAREGTHRRAAGRGRACADKMAYGRDLISDWSAETLGGLTA